MDKFLDAPKKELFKVYHLVYEKSYELNSEEGIKKYKVFKNNLDYITKRNSEGLTYTLGINQFTDMTHEEYKATLIPKSVFKNAAKDFKRFLESGKYVNFDEEADKEWDTQNFSADWESILVTPKNQKSCGDCWAFSAAGALEGTYYNARTPGGEPVSFSEQQITSCVTKGGHGCNGGLSNYAFRYTAANGIMNESSYPFTSGNGNSGNCTFNASEVVATNTGYNYCTNDSGCGESTKNKTCTLAVWQQMLSTGPFSVYMEASSKDFQHYKCGILNLTPSDCSAGSDHAVVAVGWGYNATSNQNFVKVRNSWGTSWGEQGYFRIQYNASNYDTCYITGSAFQPTW